MKKWYLLVLIFSLILPGFMGTVRAADKYPTRAIELVIPFSPGGSADMGARAYCDILAKHLKVPISAVNRPGGAGIQGTSYVIKSKKDGYTLLGSTDTPLMIMPVISKEVTYDPIKDVVPIGYFGYAPAILAVRADSPFKTLAELIEFVRKNPGRIKNALARVGTESQFNLQLSVTKRTLKSGRSPSKAEGRPWLRCSAATRTCLRTRSVLGAPSQGRDTPGSGDIFEKAAPGFPRSSTTAELGHPDVNFEVWLALFAPRGVPQEVIDVLVPATEKAFKDPEARQRAMNGVGCRLHGS